MASLIPRTVLVTGSNRGIGLELVKQLITKANPPEKIFATCRNPDGPRAQELKNLAKKHKGVDVSYLDVNEPDSIKEAAARVTEQLKGAGLNLLINNAGILNFKSTLELDTSQEMLEVLKTNLIGPMLVSQAFLPLLKKAAQESTHQGMNWSKAAIFNVTSYGASISNVFQFHEAQIISYRFSKASLNMLTRCQALAYVEDQILCVPLNPGWLDTDMGSVAVRAPMSVEEGVQKVLNTLSKLSEKDNGIYMDLEGNVLPW